MGGFQDRYDSDEDFEMKEEDIKWIGKGVREKGRVFYSGVTLDGSLELHQGDTVLVKQTNAQAKLRVATIGKLFHESPIGASAHLQYFCSATDAVLGDKADPQELYFTDECKNVALTQIWTKCTVERRLGSSSPVHETVEPGDFWASHWYDGGSRFEKMQPPVRILKKQDAFLSYCESCARKTAKEVEGKSKVVRNKNGKITGIRWMGNILRHGDGVMIPSNSVKLPRKKAVEKADRLWEVEEGMVDNTIFTEAYRKNKGQTKAKCNPLQIAQILEIKEKTKTKSISMKIRLFYRPGDSSCSIWQNENLRSISRRH